MPKETEWKVAAEEVYFVIEMKVVYPDDDGDLYSCWSYVLEKFRGDEYLALLDGDKINVTRKIKNDATRTKNSTKNNNRSGDKRLPAGTSGRHDESRFEQYDDDYRDESVRRRNGKHRR